MTALVLRRRPAESLARRRRVVQHREEEVPVPIRQRRGRRFGEVPFALRNYLGLPDAQLRLADLFDDKGGVGESLGQADASFFVTRADHGVHGAPPAPLSVSASYAMAGMRSSGIVPLTTKWAICTCTSCPRQRRRPARGNSRGAGLIHPSQRRPAQDGCPHGFGPRPSTKPSEPA